MAEDGGGEFVGTDQNGSSQHVFVSPHLLLSAHSLDNFEDTQAHGSKRRHIKRHDGLKRQIHTISGSFGFETSVRKL